MIMKSIGEEWVVNDSQGERAINHQVVAVASTALSVRGGPVRPS